MTATPRLNKALNTTVHDLQNLGKAAKNDLQHLSQDAMKLAQAKVIDPGFQMFNDTKRMVEEQAHRSMDMARVKMNHMRDYVVENPGYAIAGAIAGGVILGLLIRR